MEDRLVRFAIIGCGKIAHFHADVIKHLGYNIDIVVATKNSVNIDSFAKKYAINKKIDGFNSFLRYYKKSKDVADCILVCTPWNVTENVLKKLLPLDVPIMAEKPAALSVKTLNSFRKHNTRNLFVAYNRRFYDFIPFLKELIQEKLPICVDILSAEPCEMIMDTYGKKIRDYMLYFYSTHIIDLMFYLFGSIEIRNIFQVLRNKKHSWICELYSKRYECPVHMKILMDCPQNSYLKIFFEKEMIEVKPLERMILYDRLENKICEGRRIYTPTIKAQMETSATFKPGFLNQMKYFIENFVYKKNPSDEYFGQLEKVTSLCDKIASSKNK